MPAPLYTNDALDNWKRYGGDPNIVNSYVAATGSSDSLQVPRTNIVATPSPAAPPSPVKQMPAATAGAAMPAGYGNLKQMPNAVAPLSLDAQKQWIDQNKPTDPGAYQGPDPYSMHWGGALIEGSNTGVQDYGNWQSQRGQYDDAMRKWQSEYTDWASRNKSQQNTQHHLMPTVAGEVQKPAGQGWGVASTQQQNLGQAPSSEPPSPYAVPGQRTTPQPGTGPVQKPDKSLGAVNSRYAGVL